MAEPPKRTAARAAGKVTRKRFAIFMMNVSKKVNLSKSRQKGLLSQKLVEHLNVGI